MGMFRKRMWKRWIPLRVRKGRGFCFSLFSFFLPPFFFLVFVEGACVLMFMTRKGPPKFDDMKPLVTLERIDSHLFKASFFCFF